METRELMQVAPVIPVLVIDDVAHATPLAEALVAGGLSVLEVTLRTPVAMAAMQAMAAVEGAIVGVGTALSAADLKRSQDNGATFAVTPGFTRSLGETAQSIGLPLLPGVMTPAEIIEARDLGYTALKFFPAEQAGGTALLKAFSGPFPRHGVLPYRRHRCCQGERLPCIVERTVCRWLMGGTFGHDESR